MHLESRHLAWADASKVLPVAPPPASGVDRTSSYRTLSAHRSRTFTSVIDKPFDHKTASFRTKSSTGPDWPDNRTTTFRPSDSGAANLGRSRSILQRVHDVIAHIGFNTSAFPPTTLHSVASFAPSPPPLPPIPPFPSTIAPASEETCVHEETDKEKRDARLPAPVVRAESHSHRSRSCSRSRAATLERSRSMQTFATSTTAYSADGGVRLAGGRPGSVQGEELPYGCGALMRAPTRTMPPPYASLPRDEC